MASSQIFPLKFKSKRILCIGEVMCDRFFYGDVTRISPEAPVPVLSRTKEESMLGGAGNAVANLIALGASVEFITITGIDQISYRIKQLLKEQGDRLLTNVITENGRITPLKTRFCSGSQQMLRVDHEDSKPILSSTERSITRYISHSISNADAVLVCDYDKGMLTPEVMDTIKSNCAFYRRPLIIDPKKRPFELYAGATLITPNQSEWDSFNITRADQFLPMAVLLTKGADGMGLMHEGTSVYLPSVATEVYDVSGAGDTVASVMTLMIACDADLPSAAYIANIAAGIAVGKRGTTPVTFDELIHAIHQKK